MKYFSNFPKLITKDLSGNITLGTNLLARVNFIPSLINNPALFYTYEYQEEDKPEIIANKYYNNPYRYWMFLYGNNIIDPQWDLPLSSKNFEAYLNDKYASAANTAHQTVLAYTQSTIKYYKKVVTTYDSIAQQTTVNEFNVDLDTYNNLPVNLVTTKSFPSGSYVVVTQSKRTESIYDYELQSNEDKRQMKVIDVKYAEGLEQKLQSLMSV